MLQIPNLTRSSLHRLFQRHYISRLRQIAGEKPARRKFAHYPIGYFHIGITEVGTEEGKLYLFIAIRRTGKFAYAELLSKYGKIEVAQFLRNLIAVVPCKIHTILTGNSVPFTHRKTDKYDCLHSFDRVCLENGTEHCLTRPNHPWTNGQVERMNHTLQEATVKRYHYDNHRQLREHLSSFLNACSFSRRLKTLRGLNPYEYIIKCWQNEPERFIINSSHYKVALNSYIYK